MKISRQVALLLLFTVILCLNFHGQNNDTWTAFWNADTTLIGYKNNKGEVTINPKFTGYVNALKFDHIIAVSEETDKGITSYYLTKYGKSVGRDSLYIFDNGSDCESEGFIRFKDKKSDKVGLFNRNGEIVIPAIYDELKRVNNGMVVGLKGAKKTTLHKEEHLGCNHFTWVGGQQVLIDTLNTLLIENFVYDAPINLYSLEKTKLPHSDSIRQSYLAKDGSYYSFITYEKEFKQWINKELLDDFTKEKLINVSNDSITWQSKEGWATTNSTKLIEDNFPLFKSGLLELLAPKTDYFISSGGLNQFIYEGPEFEKYYTNCGRSKDWMYPTLSIIISYNKNKDFSQNHYTFLRTDEGYKLISITLQNENIK